MTAKNVVVLPTSDIVRGWFRLESALLLMAVVRADLGNEFSADVLPLWRWQIGLASICLDGALRIAIPRRKATRDCCQPVTLPALASSGEKDLFLIAAEIAQQFQRGLAGVRLLAFVRHFIPDRRPGFLIHNGISRPITTLGRANTPPAAPQCRVEFL